MILKSNTRNIEILQNEQILPRLPAFKKMFDENCEDCNFNVSFLDDLIKCRKDSVEDSTFTNLHEGNSNRTRFLSC
jgi:hypothetical protein